jgi:hypothetical protein
MDDRRICVVVGPRNNIPIDPIQSTGTLVFSKRKNKEQRLILQEEEKRERERVEDEADKHLLETSMDVKRVQLSSPSASSSVNMTRAAAAAAVRISVFPSF